MLFAVAALAISSTPVTTTWGAPVTAPGAIRPSTDPGPYVAVPTKTDTDGAEPTPTPTQAPTPGLTTLSQDITDIPPGASKEVYAVALPWSRRSRASSAP